MLNFKSWVKSWFKYCEHLLEDQLAYQTRAQCFITARLKEPANLDIALIARVFIFADLNCVWCLTAEF